MTSNLDRFRTDLESLIARGSKLEFAMTRDCRREEFEEQVNKQFGDKAEKWLKGLPNFSAEYQTWYSEALSVVRQLLPDRLEDFKRHYDKPKTRKDITYENYHIEDYLQGLRVTRSFDDHVIVDGSAAIPRFRQQLAIVEAAQQRFASSLFDIATLVRADLCDSEIEAAKELLSHKFARAAGAICGVVLEKHLSQVCQDHSVTISKKHPSIGELNDALKAGGVVDIAQWRFVQHLGDLRNLCDHDKKKEPTEQQVSDLIDGVTKVMKTLL